MERDAFASEMMRNDEKVEGFVHGFVHGCIDTGVVRARPTRQLLTGSHQATIGTAIMYFRQKRIFDPCGKSRRHILFEVVIKHALVDPPVMESPQEYRRHPDTEFTFWYHFGT